MEKSGRRCLRLEACSNNFSNFLRERIIFEIFLERRSLCYFGDEIGQLCFKEAGQNLMKSIFIWKFDLSFETGNTYLNFICLLWVLKSWKIFVVVVLSIWRHAAVHLSVNCHITGSGGMTWRSTPWQQNWEIFCSLSEAICWWNCLWEPSADDL